MKPLTSTSSALFSSSSTDAPASQSQKQSNISNSSDSKEEEEEWSTYEKLVRKLYMTNLFNPVKLGLENMNKLHELLGSPMNQSNKIKVIHIAGSNGKGSVALKTANTFSQSKKYKVGLFVSPHISSFRERIQINGVPISEAQVEIYLQEIFDICEVHSIPATFFEVTTALAFHIFAQENVDVVVLETGLGGRLDATNVITKPALSVITSIGLEHTRILGDTIELIALEKGGIMKRNCPVLVGSNLPLNVLKDCSKEKGVSDFYVCGDVLGPANNDDVQEEDTNTNLALSFNDYDIENSRIATAALKILQFDLSSEDIAKGVSIRPPCRFEEMDISTTVTNSDGTSIQKNVRVILDVAHNPQAMEYLMIKLQSNYPNRKNQRIVVGMSSDKDLKHCTDILLNHVEYHPEKLHLVEASHPRAASISSILEANEKLVDSYHESPNEDELNEHGRDVSSVSKQVHSALQLAAKNDELLVICGSVFIMADAREELGIVEPRDSKVIAEVSGAGLRSSQENFNDDKK